MDSLTPAKIALGLGLPDKLLDGLVVSSADVTPGHPTEQAQSPDQNVTLDRQPLTAAERKRRQRERDRAAAAAALTYERPDWKLFLDPLCLPQKAGCDPCDLRALVLKELVDNAFDAGANAELDFVERPPEWGPNYWIVKDDGPGIDPELVPDLFSVNRPLRSSKLRRLPTRGALGNGLRVVSGAVAAFNGWLVVETRGHRLALTIDHATGLTHVEQDEPIPFEPGTKVCINIGPHTGDPDEAKLAALTLGIAGKGKEYKGESSPWWYAPEDLHRMLQSVTPPDSTVSAVCGDLGCDIDDDRPARSLTKDETASVLATLRESTEPVAAERLGNIGKDAFECAGYATMHGEARMLRLPGARIPYVVEAWAECNPVEGRGNGEASLVLFVNRTATLARLHTYSVSGKIIIRGCGLNRRESAATGDYKIVLSLIVPYVQITTDGKEPDLTPFGNAIIETVSKACRTAHRAMIRPVKEWTIKDAAYAVMRDAYMKASGGGKLPANARQIMYAARPAILKLTGKDSLDDAYFTQTLLPDYIAEHPDETRDWDVVFDSRGVFIEPHTGRRVELGTLEVRQYLGERPYFGSAVELDYSRQYPTCGPENRYDTVLFVEKEGFWPLLEAAQIAQRFDVGLASTKGMSNVAIRYMFDRLVERGMRRVLVAHDFDKNGFSIFGTLGTDSRRYKFTNKVTVLDIGIRLSDVKEMGLQSEPYSPIKDESEWRAFARTLQRHGATDEEINFLDHKRVELNAVPANQFVAFLERKLTEHGVRKIVPSRDVLLKHARRVREQVLVERFVDQNRARLTSEAEAETVPDSLADDVRAIMQKRPHMSWDAAVWHVVQQEPLS